jgi:NAD(P)-dependent dehydrogenase (short-subunit alcohol dehydrogenase family)
MKSPQDPRRGSCFSWIHLTSINRQRVVLVTGASSGLGLACAAHLQQRGYVVFGASRHAREIATLRMDVADEQSVPAGVQAIVRQAGRLEAVINCAGVGYAGAAEDHTVAEAQEQLNTHFFGTFRVCRAASPWNTPRICRAHVHPLRAVRCGSLTRYFSAEQSAGFRP